MNAIKNTETDSTHNLMKENERSLPNMLTHLLSTFYRDLHLFVLSWKNKSWFDSSFACHEGCVSYCMLPFNEVIICGKSTTVIYLITNSLFLNKFVNHSHFDCVDNFIIQILICFSKRLLGLAYNIKAHYCINIPVITVLLETKKQWCFIFQFIVHKSNTIY